MSEVGLIEIDNDMEQAVRQGDAAFRERYGASMGENATLIRAVVQQTRHLLQTVPREVPWGGYLAADGGVIVGMCGFKTGPQDDGSIEIAYGTCPPFEGRGYATAMAHRLTAMALASSKVRRVIAHTLPERNASTRVLEKLGMTCIGAVIDPEDGQVWRWVYPSWGSELD
jgi:[ribosomal protein S5]-alanine N-acetyltransferase